MFYGYNSLEEAQKEWNIDFDKVTIKKSRCAIQAPVEVLKVYRYLESKNPKLCRELKEELRKLDQKIYRMATGYYDGQFHYDDESSDDGREDTIYSFVTTVNGVEHKISW